MPEEELFFGFSCKEETRGEAVELPFDKLTHMHLIGTTGFGKSTLMVLLAVQLILKGYGVAVVDPAGDISRRILITLLQLGFFQNNLDAFERFVYLDVVRAAREQKYLAFNILGGDYDPHTAASIVIEAYRRVWPTMQDGNWGNIELMTTLAAVVLAYNKLPLLPYLEDFYRNPTFRTKLLANVEDARVAQWLDTLEVKKDNPKVPTIVETTLKRIMLLSTPPVLGYALSQPDNLLDGRKLLATQRSVCINLNLDDDNAARYFGALFTRQMELAIKAHGQLTPRGTKRPYLLILDEVHNFIAQSGQAVDRMFAEARRAGVFVVAAHQYWGQLYEGTSGGFSQCGIVAVFQQKKESGRLSAEHAGLPIDLSRTKQTGVSPQGPREQTVSPHDQIEEYVEFIDKLPIGQAIVRLPGNRLHLLETVPTDDEVDEQELAAIEQEYLRRYFRPLGDIEGDIARIRGVPPAPVSPSSQHRGATATLHSPPPPVEPQPVQPSSREKQPADWKRTPQSPPSSQAPQQEGRTPKERSSLFTEGQDDGF
jgi:energy-coupling factor transporter ATP-binding protein EcfA2